MLQISGIDSTVDQRLIKRYCHFVLSKFVSPKTIKKAIIRINVISLSEVSDPKERKELKKYSAWMTYDGTINDRKTFTITMDRKEIKSKAKKQITQYKYFLMWLGHELVHVKQYLTSQMFDYVNGNVKFEGKIYAANDSSEAYWFSPWEVEAHGYQEGLYRLFLEDLKKKRKL